MPALNMLIKPSSDSCNLRCRYCFYHDVAEKRSQRSYGRMSYETLDALVRRAFAYAEGFCNFSFQGGEPMLRGIDFFRELIRLQEKYNTAGVPVNNSIQTNGTLIDEEWARFFAENKFLVGLSMDGNRRIHDLSRLDGQGKGSFAKVYNAAKIMDRHKVDYNILTVVTKDVARNVGDIYRFFRDCGFKFIQPIPCLDPFGEEGGGNPYSLGVDDYAYFLKTLFDLWYEDMLRRRVTVIRNFDNYIGIIAGFRPEMCSMLGECICQFVIEADGSVYPCDFYVLDEWRLGNVLADDLRQMEESERAKSFIEISRYVDEECVKCKYRYLCRGGCRRNREPCVNGRPSLNIFCKAYKEFFAYAESRLTYLTKRLAEKRL